MAYNYKNIIESKNIDTVEFYLKELLRDVDIMKMLIRENNSEIKKKLHSIDNFEKRIEQSKKDAKLLKNALKQIKKDKK